MLWLIPALLLSLVAAAFAEANRHFKMEGFRLNFWRTVVTVAMLLPTALLVAWPPPSMFYVAAVFSGVVIAVSPAIRMSLSAKKMGRVTTLFMPVEAVIAFLLWLMLDEALRQTLLAQPLTLVFIFVSFLIISGSLAAIRKNDAGWKAFLIVAPLGVLHGLSGVLGKFGMAEASGLFATVMLYMLISNLMAILFSACFLSMQRDATKSLCPPGMMRAAAIYGAMGLVGQFSFFVSINLAPNPGYVVAIAMLAPVWIMLYHKARGWPDDASPIAGLVMVAGTILLVIVTI